MLLSELCADPTSKKVVQVLDCPHRRPLAAASAGRLQSALHQRLANGPRRLEAAIRGGFLGRQQRAADGGLGGRRARRVRCCARRRGGHAVPGDLDDYAVVAVPGGAGEARFHARGSRLGIVVDPHPGLAGVTYEHPHSCGRGRILVGDGPTGYRPFTRPFCHPVHAKGRSRMRRTLRGGRPQMRVGREALRGASPLLRGVSSAPSYAW